MSHSLKEERLRVIVMEDEPLYLDLLVKSLAWYPQLDIVGTFTDAESYLASAPSLQPQVSLLDIELPGDMNGLEVGLQLREALPDLGVVLLSNHCDPAFRHLGRTNGVERPAERGVEAGRRR